MQMQRIVFVIVRLGGGFEGLLEVVRALGRMGVKILSCFTQVSGEELDTMLVAESGGGVPEVEVGLRVLPAVKSVRIVDSGLDSNEARLIGFTLGDVRQLLGIFRDLGSGGLALMYHIGHRVGKLMAERSRGRDGLDALKGLLARYEALGHGRFEVVDYVEGVACRVVARGLFECVGGRSAVPRSHFFRGLLAGFISGLWARNVRVSEIRCAAMGDEWCEFEVR